MSFQPYGPEMYFCIPNNFKMLKCKKIYIFNKFKQTFTKNGLENVIFS